MPHKVTTVALLDECSTAVEIAGSCNAILKRSRRDVCIGDMFDGVGFTRGLRRRNFMFAGARCLVVGSGGVGSAIAASLAADGVAVDRAFRYRADVGRRPRRAPAASIIRSSTCALRRTILRGYDLVVNATPLGMNPDDPLPIDVARLSPATFVGEVVMKQEITPLLQAARDRGCRYQVGTDMLFEMIPAYLEFFGFGTTTPEELRAVAKVAY